MRQFASRNPVTDHRIPVGRLEKYGKLENDVIKAGEEIKSLARFVAAQRTAFRKLLKKHKKWTGSTRLEERFRDEVLEDPKSFTNLDLGPLLDEYSSTRQAIRLLYDGAVLLKAGQQPSQESTASSSTIRKLQDAIDSESKVVFDTAIATVPLGESGTFASYFVHPENIVELQVFLLQHAEYFGSRSRSNSIATPVSTPSRNGSLGGSKRPDFHMIAADSLRRFAEEQSSLTVDDREHRPGSFPQRTKACVRWNNDEHAMACLRLKSGKAKSAALKRKHARAFFDRNALFSASQSAAGEESDEDVDSVRQEFVRDANVQPLFQLTSSRSRLTSINAGSTTMAMATLDTNIVIESVPEEGPASTTEFPFGLLLVRQEGNTDSGLLAALRESHLVEHVRGFSLEYHAVWAVHKPSNMSAPFWLPLLDEDIRKLPPAAIRHTSRSGSASRSAESRGSMTAATDSPTAVETTNSSLRLDTPPLKSFRKKRRQQFAEEPMAPQQRYWSEYDHPEDGEEDPNAFVLYVDPNEKSFLDHFFDRIGNLFGMKSEGGDAAEQPLLPSSPQEDDGTSSDEEAGLLGASTPRGHKKRNTFGTFATRQQHNAVASPAVLALREQHAAAVPRFTMTCFAAANVILLLALILSLTGRHKYAHAVDAGVFTAIIASLIFVVVGFLAVLRVGPTAISLPAWAACIAVLVLDAVASGGLVAWILRGH